ncbi:MAG: hypothetical protein WCZ23_16195 [Rhodospirillaceae bacterium]
MLKKLTGLVVLGLALLSAGAEARDTSDEEMLYDFLAGSYWLIGKSLDSQDSFVGKVGLSSQGNRLIVTRTVGGAQTVGEGRIEPIGHDGGRALRVRYVERGVAYEGTYLWQSDADNYARLTGYVYRPGEFTESPGMEALFIVQ